MAENKKSGNGITTLLIILILIGIAVLAYVAMMPTADNTTEKTVRTTTIEDVKKPSEFTDGLSNPNSTTRYPLNEFGEGIASIEVFNIDINNDQRRDRIIRTRYENGTAHFYYEYRIELNTDNGLVNITPNDFRTIEGADCALQKLQFEFKPEFQITKISRPWEDTWETPTGAVKTVFRLVGNEFKLMRTAHLPKVCDVSQLF